jgi:hypothetical protein
MRLSLSMSVMSVSGYVSSRIFAISFVWIKASPRLVVFSDWSGTV